ncbi:MAG: cytochrome C oxidase subunit IV family protein [Verrucomicrobiota bacterium]
MNTKPIHDSPADPKEIGRNVRTQIQVGITLVIFTLVAVGISYVPFHSQRSRILAVIAVAAVNAIMVSGISMHLKTEKKIIGQFLVFTIVFVIGLFALTALAFFDSTGLH